MQASAFIALGTNVPFGGLAGGALLARAAEAMREAGLVLRARSSVWRTPAWPAGSEQPDYRNAVVAIDAAGHTPQSLYAVLRDVEARFGRERRTRWAARTLDLDIIAMEGVAGEFEGIEIPHPRMQERGFVLAPLAEIAPAWRHPTSGATVAEMLSGLGTAAGAVREGALE
jgi:2-amino-4-hydroxy-6-hydroxymethyldihydropteridine diphosphokinase